MEIMTDIVRNIFYALCVEVFVTVIAFCIEDAKKRIVMLIFGTIIAVSIGFNHEINHILPKEWLPAGLIVKDSSSVTMSQCFPKQTIIDAYNSDADTINKLIIDNKMFECNNGESKCEWNIWKNEESFGDLFNGIYRLGILRPNQFNATTNRKLNVLDFYAKVDLILSQSDKSYSVGFIIRDNNREDYLFGINNNKQYEIIKRSKLDDSVIMVEPLSSWVSNQRMPNSGKVTLEIVALGKTVNMCVNKEKVSSITDPSPKKGMVGLYGSTYGGGEKVILEYSDWRFIQFQ